MRSLQAHGATRKTENDEITPYEKRREELRATLVVVEDGE
jgi:hypothetical protein